ncbi:MAG: hypothetical protein ACI3ZQ_02715 [Candidatus Cryptobacteroides sp.]
MKKLLLAILSLACLCCANDEETIIKAFIQQLYETKSYENTEFLEEHCSPELLAKLQQANDMDDGGYATWLFRSGHQDEKSATENETKILEISHEGDCYTYKAVDMGWEFTKRMKVSVKDNKVIITELLDE